MGRILRRLFTPAAAASAWLWAGACVGWCRGALGRQDGVGVRAAGGEYRVESHPFGLSYVIITGRPHDGRRAIAWYDETCGVYWGWDYDWQVFGLYHITT